MLSQPTKTKILPKKPTSDNAIEVEDMFLDNILPGEFHSDWERDLWGVEEPTDNPDLFFDVTGLDNFVHDDRSSTHVSEVPNSQNINREDKEAVANNFVGQDPMMQDASLQVQGSFQVVTEDDNVNRVLNNEDSEVVMEINLDAISAMAPEDAFVIAEASDNLPSETLGEESISISFNHTSFDSGFEDSFQGWGPENFEDSCHTMDISFETSLGIEDYRGIETDLNENNLVKKRVGRPPKRTKTEVTTVPFAGSKNIIEQAKKRRLRDLNNIASQKCRAKKRQARINEEILCQELQTRNALLKTKFESLENNIKILRKYLIQSGIPVDQYKFN